MKAKILIADDEKNIADAMSYAFTREGFTVEVAYDGEEALTKAAHFVPNIMILDIMMPKISGFDICRKLEDRENIGIILLTAKTDIVDKVLGLELGADDYITKPFDMRELIARVKSLIRRLQKNNQVVDQKEIRIGDLRVNLEQRKAVINQIEMDLTPKEFDLLYFLVSNIGRVFEREELLDLVWGMDFIGGTRTVDIHVQRLRKKLGNPYSELIQTVYGIGYKAIGGMR